MAFEHIFLLGKLELDVIATAAGTITIQTDIPDNAMTDRGTVAVGISTRRVVQKRLPGHFQGHLFQFTYAPGNGTSRLYGMRLWARELPNGRWGWHALPVVPTPQEWSAVALEIPPTPDSWASVRLEFAPTPEGWSGVALSIPPTPEDWSTVRLNIPPTPDGWSEVRLPIKPTPPVPEWFSLEVDR